MAIRRNRKLIRIETGLDKEADRNLSLQVIDSIGWSVIANRKAYAIAATTSAFTWCGQEITVVYERGGVYVIAEIAAFAPQEAHTCLEKVSSV